MRRRWLLAKSFLLLAGSGGCEFDLTRVDPPGGAAAHFLIALEVLRHGGPVDLSASFHPGRGDDGGARESANDVIHVNGIPVAPSGITGDGTRHYTLSGISSSVGRVVLEGPAVDGWADPGPALAIDLLRSVGTDSLNVGRAGILTVPLGGTAWEGETTVQGFWSIRVHRDTCETGPMIVQQSGNAAPPAALAIAVASLPPGTSRGFIQVEGSVRNAFDLPGRAYGIEVRRRFRGCVAFGIEEG